MKQVSQKTLTILKEHYGENHSVVQATSIGFQSVSGLMVLFVLYSLIKEGVNRFNKKASTPKN